MHLIKDAHFQTVFQTMSDGFLILNGEGQFIDVNAAYLTITEYEKNELLSLNIRDIDVMFNHSSQREQDKELTSKNSYQIEDRFESKHKSKSGKIIPVEVNVYFNPNVSQHILVCIRNNSIYNQFESQINVIERIFNNSTEAILVTDEQGIIKLVNNTFTQISGYSSGEVLGKTPAILSSGRQDKRFYKAFWQALKHKGEWSGEIWNKRKNGEIYPEWLNITSIKNHQGETTHYVSQFTDITLLKQSQKKQHFQIYHDPLTQLPNRRLLFERLNTLCATNHHKNVEFAVLFCDLDRFKAVNDSFGHNVGDEVLKAVANRIQKTLRSTDTIARSGGDEFIIIIEGYNNIENLKQVSKHILALFETPFNTKYGEFYNTCSIGISRYPEDSKDIRELISFSDIAMYKVKAQGGNNFSVFDRNQKDNILHKMELENAIHLALKNGEFEVWYQPQINSNTQNVYGIECLLRWQHPIYGLISPELFIPIAEKNGLIKKIGLFVMKSACRQLNLWRQQNIFNGIMAINVSLRQFDSNDLIYQIEETLKEENLPGEVIEIEVTESLFSDDDCSHINILNNLRQLGVKVAIDDFGTGYSSLSRLKQLPINNLKIDKCFIDNLTTDTSDVSIIKALILLSQSFDLEVIAEGVEHEEQANFLKTLGCYNHQGYLYSKALPANEFETWIAEFNSILPTSNMRQLN